MPCCAPLQLQQCEIIQKVLNAFFNKGLIVALLLKLKFDFGTEVLSFSELKQCLQSSQTRSSERG